MMSLMVDVERDCVVLAFGERGKDLPLTFDQAETVARVIRDKAAVCEGWVKSGGQRLVVSTVRAIGVQGVLEGTLQDGRLWLRFPEVTKVEKIPFESARKLADEIDATLRRLCYKVAWKMSFRRS